MKKFIVFVMILIVTVSLGVTVFFFSQDREELIANVSAEMYVNQGDTVKFDVELKHGKANHNISIKSLNEDILSSNGDVLTMGFDAVNGGACVVEISVENSKNIKPMYVTVYVGNGNPSTPFYVDSEKTLKSVASSNMPSSSYYLLLNDISLTESFTPLDKFSGNFNGNGYTISNLNIDTGNPQNPSKAGLFSEITSTGSVSNLKVSGVNINGQFENAGTIAGVNQGTITRVSVEDGLVTSTLEENANVGGICGLVKYHNTLVGRVDRCTSALNVCGYKNVGGLVGKNEGGIIINSYATYLDATDAVLAIADGANAGGVVGLNTYSDIYVSTVKNCYANISVEKADNLDASAEVNLGGVIGLNQDVDAHKLNQLMGNYFNNGFITTGVNHVVSASVNETGAKNYRGVNPFQKDAQGKVIKDTLLSYHGKTLDEATGSEVVDVPVYWDFENVWLLSSNVNNGYPTLNAHGADVPDDIAFLYDPNKIDSNGALYSFAQKVNSGTLSIENQNYFLTTDLTLNGNFTPIGTKQNPFTGVFDGGNHTITGLLINSDSNTDPNNSYAGLFGYVSATAQIKNVKIVNPTINEGFTYVGAIAGYSEGALISNCSVKDTTNSTELNMVGYRSVGGIVGLNQGIVEKCVVENMTIAVKKNGTPATDYLKYRYVGGIAGENGLINSDKYATIRNSTVLNSIIYDDYGTANGYEKENYVVVSVFDNRNLYVHIGGVCGTNNYKVYGNKVDTCKLTGDETDHRSMVGGVVALSKTLLRGKTEAEVYYNAVYESEMKGFTAAGVIGATCGLVKENACVGGVVSGFVASGLISDIRFGGKVIDCVTGTKVQNVPNKKHSYAAGLFNTSDFERGNLDYSNQGELYNCFSYCTFDAGEYENNYYDSCSKYKFIGDGWFDSVEARSRFCGEANQLIFVTTPNAKEQDFTFLGVTNLKDISGITEELALMSVTDLTALMESYNFNVTGDNSTWITEMGVYPTLRNIPEK